MPIAGWNLIRPDALGELRCLLGSTDDPGCGDSVVADPGVPPCGMRRRCLGSAPPPPARSPRARPPAMAPGTGPGRRRRRVRLRSARGRPTGDPRAAEHVVHGRGADLAPPSSDRDLPHRRTACLGVQAVEEIRDWAWRHRLPLDRSHLLSSPGLIMPKFVLPWNASMYKICASRRSRICHRYVKPSMAVKVRTPDIPMRPPSNKA
jgi:hypothetical protein